MTYEEACQVLGPDLAAELSSIVERMLASNQGVGQQHRIEAIETMFVGHLATVIHASRKQIEPIAEAQECGELLIALVTKMLEIEPELPAFETGRENTEKLNVMTLLNSVNQ